MPQPSIAPLFCIYICLIATHALVAQPASVTSLDDSTSLHLGYYWRVSSKSFQPHYQIMQIYGQVSDQPSHHLYQMRLYHKKKIFEHSSLTFEADAVISSQGGKRTDAFYRHAYVGFDIYGFEVSTGIRSFSNHPFPDELSPGRFLSQNNHRPLPNLFIGISEYIHLPYTWNYVKVKGGLIHAWTKETEGVVDHFLKHQKFAYASTDRLPLNFFMGVDHIAYYGGTHDNPQIGTLRADFEAFKSVFYPGFGSSRLPATTSTGLEIGAETINAIGNHLFTSEWGVSTEFLGFSLTFYQQQIADDDIDLLFSFFNEDQDKFLGLHIKNSHWDWLTDIVIEHIDTFNQSGLGLSDPSVPNPNNPTTFYKKQTLLLEDDKVIEQYITQRHGPEIYQMDPSDIMEFIKQNYNGGLGFGGRDDYHNHFLYPNIIQGQPAGTSLFYSQGRLNRILGADNQRYSIANNSVYAWHLGIKGGKEAFTYRFLYTYTQNRGLIEKYYPLNQVDDEGYWRFSTDADPNYFFFRNSVQHYIYISGSYCFINQWRGIALDLSLAWDTGEIYHVWGTTLGISYTLID